MVDKLFNLNTSKNIQIIRFLMVTSLKLHGLTNRYFKMLLPHFHVYYSNVRARSCLLSAPIRSYRSSISAKQRSWLTPKQFWACKNNANILDFSAISQIVEQIYIVSENIINIQKAWGWMEYEQQEFAYGYHNIGWERVQILLLFQKSGFQWICSICTFASSISSLASAKSCAISMFKYCLHPSSLPLPSKLDHPQK